MIVFIDNPNLIAQIQYQFNRPVIVFNLSSLYSGYISLTDLCTKIAPINNTGMPLSEFVQSVNFDLQYFSAITNDPNLFCKLLQIMSATYEGFIAIVLVQRDPYRDAILESLIKLIQQRYGLTTWVVEDLEDISCIKECSFTPYGLLTLIEDLKFFDQVNTNGRISIE